MNYILIVVTISISFFAISFGERIRFVGYKSVRYVPETPEQLEMLKSLETSGAIILRHPDKLNQPVDIMFAPHQTDAQKALSESMPSEVLLEDVESTIKEHEEMQQQIEASDTSDFSMLSYWNLVKVSEFSQTMASDFPNLVTLETYGQSFQGRPLQSLHISKPSSNGVKKPVIFIDGGMHAREWITVMTCCKIIQQLLDSNSKMSNMLEVYDFCVVPVVNPDGFDYSWTTNRLWRKTRTENTGNPACVGVDPNRNWSLGFGGSGTSSDPCSDIFHGPFAYSCSETRSLRDHIRSKQPVSYISMHSYSQMILLCDGCHEMRATTPYEKFNDHLKIAQKGVDTISAGGTPYTTGNSDDILYSACGTSADSIRTEKIAPLCYTFELRDTGKWGFLLPADQIEPCATETVEALRVMYLEVARTILNLDVDF